MVLESLIDPFVAKKHPFWLLGLGFVFSIISFFFALWIFKDQAGMIMVFLTVLLSVPLMYATFVEEEEEDWNNTNEGKILKEHGKSIMFLTMMFFGFMIGFTVLYVFLPSATITSAFNIQSETINTINSNSSTGYSYIDESFILLKILSNNIKVMIFSIFFAFFFGAGAIFILAWNASVIATAIGNSIRNGLAESANLIGLFSVASYLHIFTFGILRYMTHGIFEIIGYFIGALAGGIISIAVVKHGLGSEKFKNVLYDSFVLILIASVLLILGAIVEVFVTPQLF